MILRNLGSNAKICATTLICVVLLTISSPTVAQDVDQVESDEAQLVTENTEQEKKDGASIIEAGSSGMYLPLNGKSVKKFEKSLDAVQDETTPEEFITVQNALDYLLVYDLAARRDKKMLYKHLDGKTPADIVNMVKWRVEGRGRYSESNDPD